MPYARLSRALSALPAHRGPLFRSSSTASPTPKQPCEPPVEQEPTQGKDPAEPPAGLLPGVAASALVAASGFALADVLGQGLMRLQDVTTAAASPVSGIPVAILLGMGIRNSPLGLPAALQPGVSACTTTALRAGIVCIGAKLSALDIVAAGSASIPAAALCVGTGLLVVPLYGRLAKLPRKMSYLIAAGTSICGVTAVTSLAPAIQATPREQSVAIATVVAFGTSGMLLYPYLAHWALDSSQAIGMFLGLAVHDTSQVMGSALTYASVYADDAVVKFAAVQKLTRNLCLAGVVPALSILNARAEAAEAASSSSKPLPPLSIMEYIPTFVYGFIGAAALRTAGDYTLKAHGQAFGVIDGDLWTSGVNYLAGTVGGTWLLGTAMAAVGLSTATSSLRGVGYAPFAVGLAGALTVGTVGFTFVSCLPMLGLAQ